MRGETVASIGPPDLSKVPLRGGDSRNYMKLA
jgi:hypothetical protein